jgi:hypothetical protein
VSDVLLASPQELDRLADRLGDQHRLMDIVLDRTAPAKAAPEHRPVQDDLFGRHFGSCRCCSKRAFAALRRRPHLDLVRGDVRRAVLRLHGRVCQIRRGIFGLDALRSRGERGVDIAVLAHHRGLRRGEPAAQQLGDIGA